MKVQICGYSGSGKSTLAKKIGQYHNIVPLHLDSIHFKDNWEEAANEIFISIIEKEIQKENWIIDGTYFSSCPERYELADIIYFLNFNRFSCFKYAHRRYKTNKGKARDDMAPGCIEKFDLEFSLWLLFGGRTRKRKKMYRKICRQYNDKVVVFNNRHQLNKYFLNYK